MNTPDERSPDEQRLHDALHRAADHVTPGPDGLAQIRRRTARVPAWRNPVVLGLVGATALAAAVIVGGVALLNDSDDPVATTASSPSTEPTDKPGPTPTDGTTPAPDPTAAEPTGPTQAITVPVYYVTDTEAGARLTREFHAVETALPPVAAAVEQLLAAPADPDYTSLWQPGVRVRSADVTDAAIEVDLDSSPSLAEPFGDDAELAVQQLVYTATAAASMHSLDGSLPVRVTVDGEPVTDLFGELDLSEPVQRQDPLDVRQLVQINNPGEGATVTSPVVVDGEGASFEANLAWEVRQDGDVVESNFTTAEECCTFAPFEFTVDLEPGTYEIVVSEVDASGGEGRAPFSDSKTFTVE